MTTIRSRRSLDLFTKKLDRESSDKGCWLWTGASWAGYGRLTRGMATYKAHRFAYEAFVGPIPEGMHVLHRCDEPACCNPDHLLLGDHSANMRDREDKRRIMHPRGERHGRARLTRRQVREIRKRAASGEEQKAIAAEFGVTPTTVSGIVRRKIWRHV